MDFFPQRANHSFTLLAEKNSKVSKCLSQFENILEFLVSWPCFFMQLYKCGPVLKVSLKRTFQGICSTFIFLSAFHLAGQLFKMWYNQTAPIYIGYFKIDAHESLFLYTLASQPVKEKNMVKVNIRTTITR